ncbi:MAG: YfhO family protein [Chitinophagaceae bacterium]|nr:YfhO family protein [Chitinophagaceae bacterium]
MKQVSFKKLLPHIVAVIVFLLVSVIYCKPVLEGKTLSQHDIQGWKGMAQQSFEAKEKTGHFPLWTNSMFSGMPAYQIAMDSQTNIGEGVTYINKIFSLGLPMPISFFFLACLCFYILCLVGGANPWLGILGAIAYAYSTYNPIIIGAGHNTKMFSIAFAPMVIAGILLLFQKKYLLGFVITAFFTSNLIGQNHLQIVYYTIIIIAAMAVAYLIKCIKEKQIAHALKALTLGLVAGLIGLGTTAVTMLPTFEYAKESMRGGVSQLSLEKDSTNNKTKGGLDKDYALRWSFGKMETFTIMIPGLFGGSNGGDEHDNSAKMVEKLTEIGVPEENAVGITNGYSYWGGMSSLSETTSGPAYIGAIVCFLFIFGMVYLKSWHKWWIATASIIGIVFAWGSSFQAFNYFMLDYLPFYSKFRAPSMAMVIPQLCIPLLGVLGLSQLISTENNWTEAWKKLKLSVLITAGVLLVLSLFYFTTDYTGKGDAQIKDNFKQNFQQVQPGQPVPPQLEQQADEMSKGLIKALREDRKSLAGKDLARTFVLITLAALLLGLFVKKKINALLLTVSLIFLTGYDLLSIDQKYLNADNYREAEEVEANFTPTAVDLQIKQDPDHANVRVFNQTVNFTNESLTSYHHNSIGGYHPAKLGLYQDIIENQLGKGNMQVFNMLNTKYFIVPDQAGTPVAQINPGAFGNCWLVKGIKFVNTANEEMLALDNTNLKDTAVVNNDFKATIKQLPQFDSSAFIKLAKRENDYISYTFSSSTAQFAVLSEVYYSAGWNAYIDEQKTGYAKVNYVLRGLYVPSGKHTIEFKFEPKSFIIGRNITIWSYILIYLSLIAAIVYYIKNKNNKKILVEPSGPLK